MAKMNHKSTLSFAIASAVLLGVGFPVAFLVSYRHALAAGKNSIPMRILGRKGSIFMLRVLNQLAGKSREQMRQGMLMEAKARFELAEKAYSGGNDRSCCCFVGSSTFTYWTHLQRDMATATTTKQQCELVNLAFGGSITADLLPHMDYIANRYRPKVIVYYCGANDLSYGRTPVEAAEGFIQFAKGMRERLTGIRIVYVSISICPLQRYQNKMEFVKRANALVEDFIIQDELKAMRFVDINRDKRFLENWDWFLNDGLHLNDVGHAELSKHIRPALEELLK